VFAILVAAPWPSTSRALTCRCTDLWQSQADFRTLFGGKRNGYVFTYKAAPPDDQGKISGYTVSARL
jgi:hypothetical protein